MLQGYHGTFAKRPAMTLLYLRIARGNYTRTAKAMASARAK